METHVCAYCGGEATYQMTNGTWCCSEYRVRCPEIRRRIRLGNHKVRGPASETRKQAIKESLQRRKARGDYDTSEYTCPHCHKVWVTNKYGYACHVNYCSNGKHGHSFGTHLTDAHKQAVSKGMKKAHEEGRAGTWIGLRKRSFAEQYWFNIFERNLGANTFTNNFHVKECHYWLDFAWPEKKIYFEVDGVTHYTEEGKRHDAIRTERLNELGWKLIGRCNWSEYQRLSNEQRGQYVNSVLKMISQP